MKFALSIKTNKDKSTEIVRTLLLTPPYIHITYVCMCNDDAKKGQHKVLILKKLSGLCPSRSDDSMYVCK